MGDDGGRLAWLLREGRLTFEGGGWSALSSFNARPVVQAALADARLASRIEPIRDILEPLARQDGFGMDVSSAMHAGYAVRARLAASSVDDARRAVAQLTAPGIEPEWRLSHEIQ